MNVQGLHPTGPIGQVGSSFDWGSNDSSSQMNSVHSITSSMGSNSSMTAASTTVSLNISPVYFYSSLLSQSPSVLNHGHASAHQPPHVPQRATTGRLPQVQRAVSLREVRARNLQTLLPSSASSAPVVETTRPSKRVRSDSSPQMLFRPVTDTSVSETAKKFHNGNLTRLRI